MNVCKIMNRLCGYSDYIMNGSESSYISQSEYDLIDIFLYSIMCAYAMLLLSWWLVPLRLIITKLKLNEITFKCER